MGLKATILARPPPRYQLLGQASSPNLPDRQSRDLVEFHRNHWPVPRCEGARSSAMATRVQGLLERYLQALRLRSRKHHTWLGLPLFPIFSHGTPTLPASLPARPLLCYHGTMSDF